MITPRRGRIKSFDERTGNIVITLNDELGDVQAHSTSCSSGNPTRFPVAGELADVLCLDSGDIVGVRVGSALVKNILNVKWSAEDNEYVGLCADFPSLSWLAPTHDEALKGIQRLVSENVGQT